MKKKYREINRNEKKKLDVEIFLETNNFIETLPNGVKHKVSYKKRTLRIVKNLKYLQIIFIRRQSRLFKR